MTIFAKRYFASLQGQDRRLNVALIIPDLSSLYKYPGVGYTLAAMHTLSSANTLSQGAGQGTGAPAKSVLKVSKGQIIPWLPQLSFDV